MTQKRINKILYIRMDRIGDLVLSLSADQIIPCEHAEWWISPGLRFVADRALPQRHAKEVQRKWSWKQFWQLKRDLTDFTPTCSDEPTANQTRGEKGKNLRPDIAVIFHAPWWVSFLLWITRIPIRIGPSSQWHHFLFLNRRIRQKRSRAEYSELEYNWMLVEQAWQELSNTTSPLKTKALPLRLTSELPKLKQINPASQNTKEINSFLWPSTPYHVVHPGMGGSALNWPTEHYAKLIANLIKNLKQTVVITGTNIDQDVWQQVENKLKSLEIDTDSKNNPHLINLINKINGEQLISVLQSAKNVIAPSTGVLHLAASTGTRTIGLMSPVRVQSARRWGPQGDNSISLSPQTTHPCPGVFKCLGSGCSSYDCMTLIRPEDVVALMELSGEAAEPG